MKNPSNFTFTGGLANSQWAGYIGSRPAGISTCTTPAASFTTPVAAANLESTTGSTSCTSSSSVNIDGQSDQYKRFVIKAAGNDPVTGNNLSYLPPDTSFHTSIRLGNSCQSAEAEMLIYSFDVTADNALVTIWYAMSLENALHASSNNPEFTIVVEKQDPVTQAWSLAGGNALCYIKQSPASGEPLGDFQQSGYNLYLPWRKVVINLQDLIYWRVRIKIAAGDCSQSGHYGYCYFAGECQSMSLKANGCAAGETETVATIAAPNGATAYEWYRSRTGRLDEGVNDLSNYVLIPGATESVLNATISQFTNLNTNETLNENTFLCRMTTYMNPAIPVYSNLTVNVGNTKPTLIVDSIFGCEANITLRDLSVTPYHSSEDETVDTTKTRWYFYNSANPTPQTLADSSVGPSASHTFNNAGNYCVRIRTSTYDSTCWNEKTVNFRVYKKPTPVVNIDRNNLCEGDTIRLFDQTMGSTYHRWITPDTDFVAPAQATRLTFNTTTDVRLITRNANYFMSDTTGDGITEPTYCYNDTTFTIFVEKYPEVHVLGDTIVCNGDQSDVSVTSDVPNTHFNWYQIYGSTAPFIEDNDRLVTSISDDRTYFVKAITPFGCEAWDSINLYLVKPDLHADKDRICVGDSVHLTAGQAAYFEWTSNPPDPFLSTQSTESEIVVNPEQTTVYSVVGHGTNGCSATALSQKITVYPWPIQHIKLTPDYIDSENPSVQFADLSENSTTSLWNFGNGNTSTLRTVVFSFSDLSQDSILISLTTGNELGCSRDTSFYIPVGIFAVWFPNAFTPRLETNNIFKPFTANDLEDYELYIYDRSGTLVFHTNNIEEGWDGKYRGHDCKPGAYVYITNYRRTGVKQLLSQKGTVTIIR
ncbi:MAG: gliding motility-associated C-terminal domain-containing protein [Bacteroidales bacterium]|nr:gliding motility-associated C-terminal domain-containing protein [Bacteroidales bacterium]